MLAYVLRRQEKFAEAAVIMIDLNDRIPQSSSVAMHVSETLAVVERYDEALEQFDTAIAYRPDEEGLYLSRAELLLRMDRLPEAIEQYRDALQHDCTVH